MLAMWLLTAFLFECWAFRDANDPLNQYKLRSVSVGLSPNSFDVIFRGVIADEFLPLPQCKLVPAHIREWSFYVISPFLPLVSAEFHSDPHFVSFNTHILCEKQGNCTVQVYNECYKSGEMRVQAVLSFLQSFQSVSTSFYVRKRCGGVQAEGLLIAFQPSLYDSPISVVGNRGETGVGRVWLGVSEEYQSSYISIRNLAGYAVESLSVTVRDREVLDVRVIGDVREVEISFLEVGQSERLIDNLSEEYIDAVSINNQLSIQQLTSLLNRPISPKTTISHIRIDPEPSLPDFPPFLSETISPISENPIKIRINYVCFEPGVTEIQFNLQLNHTFNPYEPVQFSWDKTCGGYINPYLLIGTVAEDWDILQQGLVQSLYEGKMVISADVRTHLMYLSVEEGEQRVAQPNITTLGVCTATASPMLNTLLVPLHTANFSVAYQCQKRGECSVRLVIDMDPPLAPYGKVELKWKKHCGGQIKGLNIYSKQAVEGHLAADIMANGTYIATGPLTIDGTKVTIGLNYAFSDQLSVYPTASCESPSVCTADFPDSSVLKLSTHKEILSFSLICHSSGPSVLTLTVTVHST